MKLVSVITPTWLRHAALLGGCIPSVQAQTYPEIEHVIVSDGPDAELDRKIREAHPFSQPRHASLVWGELPEHDPKPHWGNHARRRAIEGSSGELIAYLDDDDTYRPSHLELLSSCFDDPGVDFAYSRMMFGGGAIGVDPPLYGNIGTPMIMHRRELLSVANWGGDSACEDWELVRSWLTAGAKYVMVPVVTVDVRPG